MKYSKYFGAKRCGFIKSKSVLAPKGAIHLLNENIRYDISIQQQDFSVWLSYIKLWGAFRIIVRLLLSSSVGSTFAISSFMGGIHKNSYDILKMGGGA